MSNIRAKQLTFSILDDNNHINTEIKIFIILIEKMWLNFKIIVTPFSYCKNKFNINTNKPHIHIAVA